ncbi:MAG: PAS domain S-box protein [Chitinivibrionales bacterium]|nr:PAS domain S-box protein [Chitinivibrionales bacterium]
MMNASMKMKIMSTRKKPDAACKTMLEFDKKYRQLAENMGDVIWLLDMNLNLHYVSPSVEHLLGYPVTEALKLTAKNILSPESYKHVMSIWREEQQIESMPDRDLKRTRRMEVELVRKDGTTIWGESIATCQRDTSGNPLMLQVVTRDLTGRKQAEDLLVQKEEQFRRFFDLGIVGMAIENVDGSWVSVNDTLCRIFGYSRKQLMKMHWKNLTWHEDIDKDMALFEKLVHGKIDSYSTEKRFLRKNGDIFWMNISVTCSRHEDGTVDKIYALGMDVSESKKQHEKLKLYAKRLNALVRLSKMAENSVREIADFVLKEIVALTKSDIGFIGFMDKEEKTMHIHSWSGHAMKQCTIKNKPIDFPISNAGLWADAVRKRKTVFINDYAQKHAHKKGVPKGHVPLTRLLVVPACTNRHISIIAAVGNKRDTYDTNDENQISLLCTSMLNLIRKKEADESLRLSEEKLEKQNILLNEKNIALREAMHQVKSEKTAKESKIAANIDRLIFPVLSKLRSQTGENLKPYIDLISGHLDTITSSFGKSISDKMLGLSQKEIEICMMVRNGMESKQIAAALNLSLKTIQTHRKRIRKKLDIAHKGINLATYLQSSMNNAHNE